MLRLRTEKCINSLRVKYDCDIYITDSNSKLLSGEFATYLAGRYIEFVIYPFSFREFLSMTAQKDEAITSAFANIFSSLVCPSSQTLQTIPKPVQLHILKNVVRHNNIRDVDQLDRVVTHVLENIERSFIATSLSKYFRNKRRVVSHDTILNYTRACAEAFLFFKINRKAEHTEAFLLITLSM